MDRDSFFSNWSNLHGGAEISVFVRGWLKISFFLVKPLAKLKINPNFLTLLGLVFAVLVWNSPNRWFAFIFLLISLIFDGIDGSLAIIRNVTSNQGAVIDSFVDRLSEVFWALALVRLGASAKVIFVTVLFAFTQEYLRARAAGLGQRGIEIVTIAERPVRAILIMIALLAWHFNENLSTSIVYLWLAIQTIGLFQVTRALAKNLSK